MSTETETVAEVKVSTDAVARLGPWMLGERLGRGGQGSTWRATHVETGQVAAVKRFRVADMTDWKRFDLFEREAQTLAALQHPAIPRFLGSGASEDGAERWIAMELVSGVPLSQRLAVPAAPEVLRRLFGEALDVLAYLHGRAPPVLHRDLKPHNMIARDDGRLALVDFGSVRTALATEGSSTVVGTFGYLAPEQLHGAASPASDLYALGVTMIALATGIDGASLPRRGLKVDAERVLASYPDAAMRKVWAALVEPDPDARPQDVAAVRALLEPVASPAAETPAPPGEAEPQWGWPMWTPRGPLGRVLLMLVLIALRVGLGVMGMVQRVVLPRVQARQRARIERHHEKNEKRRAEALARLARHHEVQTLKLAMAREHTEIWHKRLREQNRWVRGHQQRLPRGPGV